MHDFNNHYLNVVYLWVILFPLYPFLHFSNFLRSICISLGIETNYHREILFLSIVNLLSMFYKDWLLFLL